MKAKDYDPELLQVMGLVIAQGMEMLDGVTARDLGLVCLTGPSEYTTSFPMPDGRSYKLSLVEIPTLGTDQDN